jgi:hypothetical protein
MGLLFASELFAWEWPGRRWRASVATNQALSPTFSGQMNTWFVADGVPEERE